MNIDTWWNKLNALSVKEYGLVAYALPPFKWSERYRTGDTPAQALIAFAIAFPTYSRMYRAS